tara:strand:+ start:1073 stop:3706 length:2634 start_codon:yes stop_codon:yes gene_type:complete
MILPENENRIFYSNQLKNKIKYTIVQDKNITQASVCVCIKAGSINNPKEYQGLAHFLEHMLFLGSKKYPKENYFDETLKCHGGSSNAYTALFETVYYFTVNSNYLEKILDIFSRFFIDPLFDPDSVSREINAIHSEHMKNYNNDIWRLNYFLTLLSDKNAIINKFGTGNLDTLNKPGIREKMIEFYNNFYCSDNITVAIISPNDVNSVNNIFSNIFNQIPNKKAIENKILKEDSFFNNIGKEYQIVPIYDKTNLFYVWEIDFPHSYLKNKLFDIIDFAVEEKGPTNLEQTLFAKNLINSMSCYDLEEGLFVLKININKDKNIKKKIREINGYVKYYFNNIKKLNWNKIYDYVEKKSQILFNNTKITDEIDLIDNLVMNMHYYDPKHYYSGNKLIIEKDYELLKNNINKMSFNNCFIVYSLQDILEDIKVQTEPYYNSKYYNLKSSYVSDEIPFEFDINTDNNYIDIKPKIIKNLDKKIIPKIKSNRLWFGSISKTNESFIIGNLILYRKDLFNNIPNYIATILAINYINYKSSKYFYKEGELGYITNLSTNSITSSINILIGGFNDKYNNFFKDFIQYLNILKNELIKDDSINLKNIDKMQENLSNINFSSPWEYSDLILSEKTNINTHSYKSKLDYLKKMNRNDILESIKKRISEIINFENFAMNTFFYGNYKFKNLPTLEVFDKNFMLEINCPINTTILKNIKISKPNINETNNLYAVYFNSGVFNPFNNLILIMISTLMEQPCYDYLRTKKQLGYLVKSGLFKNYPFYYLTIKVQSEKTIDVIEENVNSFITMFLDILKDLKLEEIKQTTKELLEEKLNSIYEYNNKYLREITYKSFTFNREEILLKQLNKVSKNDIIEYFNKIKETKTILQIN